LEPSEKDFQMKNITVFAVLLALAACDTASSQGAKISAACSAKSDNVKICDCIGQKSVAELNDEERAAVLTIMSQQDGKGVMDLPLSMSVKAGGFIASATATCAAEALK
jgi:hypothetical protein